MHLQNDFAGKTLRKTFGSFKRNQELKALGQQDSLVGKGNFLPVVP